MFILQNFLSDGVWCSFGYEGSSIFIPFYLERIFYFYVSAALAKVIPEKPTNEKINTIPTIRESEPSWGQVRFSSHPSYRPRFSEFRLNPFYCGVHRETVCFDFSISPTMLWAYADFQRVFQALLSEQNRGLYNMASSGMQPHLRQKGGSSESNWCRYFL